MNKNKFGTCDYCGESLEPVFFEEVEYNKYGYKTGRVRTAVDYLICPCCLKRFAVDDSFDGEWRKKKWKLCAKLIEK